MRVLDINRVVVGNKKIDICSEILAMTITVRITYNNIGIEIHLEW